MFGSFLSPLFLALVLFGGEILQILGGVFGAFGE